MSFGQTIHIYKIKRNMRNTINIGECEKSEIDTYSANTMFETTINKNYKRDRRCMKSENDCRFNSHVVDAPESMIQDEGNGLAKQKISGCAKVPMSKVENECIF